MNPQPKLLVVCGPTGSGKGAIARELCTRFGGEILSADSRKIYRGFDVGTAKPDPVLRRKLPYHLLDVCEPAEVFSASRFEEEARRIIAGIGARGRLPVVVGGTGLYLRALLHGIVETPSRDEALRARLLAEEARTPGGLYRRLGQVDPAAAARIPAGDLIRIVRALEVFELAGRPLSAIQAEHRFRPQRYRALQIAPAWPRDELYRRIERRVDRMLTLGFLEEARALLARGLGSATAFQTVGYRELKAHLEGRATLEEAVTLIKREHRRYARRQIVWFKADPQVEWVPAPVDLDAIYKKVEQFLM